MRHLCKQSDDEIAALEIEVRAKNAEPARVATYALAVEVVADSSGKFCGNGRRFDDAAGAIAYGIDLSGRWTLVTEWRVIIAEK